MASSKQIIVVLAGLALFIGGALGIEKTATAQANFTWPEISLANITGGLNRPVHITHAGDGSQRLFVVEQAGRIQIIEQGQIRNTPFLDISDRVRSPDSGGGFEEGLLSVAFPPGYGAERDYFYVYYTRLDGDNQVSRFYLTNNSNIADPDSEEQIILFNHPQQQNHNGGLLTFGPDGYLYIGTGDGGGAFDPFDNAQDPAALLGKMLRIDVESSASPPPVGDYHIYFPLARQDSSLTHQSSKYAIPETNPFVGIPGYREEIWAIGLRNPWRYSFDRLTEDLYIADVGQSGFEEVNFQPANSAGGENYGWDLMEGNNCLISSCQGLDLVLPVTEYTHSVGHSITGGFVYRGTEFPDLEGIYFYGDFTSGRIWGLQNEIIADERVWESIELLDSPYQISTFGEDQAGELFLADFGAGEIYQIVSP